MSFTSFVDSLDPFTNALGRMGVMLARMCGSPIVSLRYTGRMHAARVCSITGLGWLGLSWFPFRPRAGFVSGGSGVCTFRLHLSMSFGLVACVLYDSTEVRPQPSPTHRNRLERPSTIGHSSWGMPCECQSFVCRMHVFLLKHRFVAWIPGLFHAAPVQTCFLGFLAAESLQSMLSL